MKTPLYKLLIFFALFFGALTSSTTIVQAQLCTPPAPATECTPPGTWDHDKVVNTSVTWSSLSIGDADNVTQKIRITGTGKVTVKDINLILKSSGAVIYFDGPELVVENGNIQLDAAGSRFLMDGGALRTYGNFQQSSVGNTIVCIVGTTIDIGEEQVGENFVPSQLSTSANWQNDKGYRYIKDCCINVTHDVQLQSSGSGTGTEGVDVWINDCIEVGDRGLNHATPTDFGVSDGDDSGNWQNSNKQSIYNTTIVVANGSYQNNSGVMTLCDVRIKVNKSGNFQAQSGGTVQGQGLCAAIEDVFENSGTWTLTGITWFSDKQNSTNVPGAGSETAEATILNDCFQTCCTGTVCTVALTGIDVDVSCFGAANGSINITVTGAQGAVTYLWSDGATSEDRSGLAPGTYSVTVTDAEGCEATQSFTITQPVVLNMTGSVIDVTITNGTNGSINATTTGGTSPYTYLWSDGATTEDRTNLAAGSYSVTVTDAKGCTFTTSFTVNQPPCAVSASGIDVDITCNGDANGSIDITVSGAQGAVTYLWSDGSTDEDRSGLAPGTYSVVVTDAAGCQTTQSFTITEPAVLGMTGVVNDVTVTNGSDGSIDVTATGGTGPYTYLWSDGSTDEDRTNLAAGTYSVTVTDANGCPYTTSFTVNEPGCAIGMSGNSINVTCNGDNDGSIDITVSGAQGAVTYLWNDGATTEDRSGLAPGSYSVVVTDAAGCQTTQAFTITEPAVLGMTGVVNDVTVTNGTDGSIDVTATGGTAPYTYLWSDGSTDEDRTNLAAGTYSVTVTDANGCPYTTSFTVNEPGCTIGMSGNSIDITCNGDDNGSIDITVSGAQGAVTYLWSDGSTDEDRSGLAPGSYSVTVTDAAGCQSTQSFTISEPVVLGMTGSVNDVTITNGSDGSIDVTATGGTGAYTYLWSDGSTDEDRTNLPAGTYSVTVTDANGCPYTTSFTVNEPGCTIGMSGNSIDITCNGDDNGSIDITVSGAQGAVTYLWSDGATTEDRSGLAPGSYSVTVTDAAGCQSTQSFTISEPTVLGMTGVVNDVTITNGSDGSIDVTATGGTGAYTYLWSDGSTDEDRTNLAAGTYSVTVTDANGCPYTASFTVNEPGCTIGMSGNSIDISCNGDDNGSIDITVSGAQGAVTYLWSDGATTEDRSGLAPGSYSVTVTDAAGCQSTQSFTISEPTVLGMTGVVNDVTITNGSDGSIDVTATGGTGAYTYLWSDGSTDEDRTNLAAGTYTVTVTDANGCPYTATFTVNEPGCTIGMSGNSIDILCNGDDNGSIDITVSGAQGSVTYLWSDGATTEDRSGLAPGTYSVVVTDAAGCQSTQSFTINEPAVLGMTAVVTDVTIANGSDGSIDVTVTGGTAPYSYLWDDGSTDEDRTNLPAGSYSVTVTDANGCVVDQQQSSFSVKEPACNITVDAGADLDKCHNDPTRLNAVASDPGATYSWSPATGLDNPNIANPVTNVHETTTYTVTVTGTDGCMASDEVTVTAYPVVKAQITVKPSTQSCPAPCIKLATKKNANYSYEWRLNGLPIVDAANKNTYCACIDGIYSVHVTDVTTGCTHTSKKMEITIAPKQVETDKASSVKDEINFSAWPNPTADQLHVTINNGMEGAVKVQLLDVFGREMMVTEMNGSQDDQIITFNMKSLSSGMYIVRVLNGSNRMEQKVMLIK